MVLLEDGEMTDEQLSLIRQYGLKTDDKIVVWEDRDVLEVRSRRGRRYVLNKKNVKKNNRYRGRR